MTKRYIPKVIHAMYDLESVFRRRKEAGGATQECNTMQERTRTRTGARARLGGSNLLHFPLCYPERGQRTPKKTGLTRLPRLISSQNPVHEENKRK